MKIFRENEEQPVLLSDEYGLVHVDNGDGTVTLTYDQDGERDTPWLLLEDGALHTTLCRALNIAEVLCHGGAECSRDLRLSMLDPVFLETYYGVRP